MENTLLNNQLKHKGNKKIFKDKENDAIYFKWWKAPKSGNIKPTANIKKDVKTLILIANKINPKQIGERK